MKVRNGKKYRYWPTVAQRVLDIRTRAEVRPGDVVRVTYQPPGKGKYVYVEVLDTQLTAYVAVTSLEKLSA